MASGALVSVFLAISLCGISCLNLTVLDDVHGETPLDPNDLLTKLKTEQLLNANLQKNVSHLLLSLFNEIMAVYLRIYHSRLT